MLPVENVGAIMKMARMYKRAMSVNAVVFMRTSVVTSDRLIPSIHAVMKLVRLVTCGLPLPRAVRLALPEALPGEVRD